MITVQVEFGLVQGERGAVSLHLWGAKLAKIVEVQLSNSTVCGLFEVFAARGSSIAAAYVARDELPRFLPVFINESNSTIDLDTALHDGDRVFITTAVCALLLGVLARDLSHDAPRYKYLHFYEARKRRALGPQPGRIPRHVRPAR